MSELIHEHTSRFRGPDGSAYRVRTCGEARADGTWAGWLEFHPEDGSRSVLRTDRETTQPSRKELAYWASGLEPVYFDGAFDRAVSRRRGGGERRAQR